MMLKANNKNQLTMCIKYICLPAFKMEEEKLTMSFIAGVKSGI